MREIVVLSGKGGTGKTSVTAALASCAAAGGPVVVADCDVDAADLHLVLAPEILERHEFIGGDKAKIDPLLCESCGLCREACRFGAVDERFRVVEESCEGCGVCAYVCPTGAAAMFPCVSGDWFVSRTRIGTLVHAALRIGEENSGKLVSTVKKAARERAEALGCPILLVDGSPGIGCPVIASLGGAAMVLMVAEPTLSAVHDIKRVHALAVHFGIPCAAILNKADVCPDLTRDLAGYCENAGIAVVGELPYDQAFVSAQLAARTVVEYDPGRFGDVFAGIWDRLCAL
ncbi:ATP-binding protein [Desulfolutivibrio sulfoxidireducens]|uniref:ATP-binding protein n=1 Tax=Desulfolutivibrio sulfoxidireducens TaxID=2773299 RepID=UPI00159EA06A|nr:ATP-binding protein [Desulfolutivibrio sulfoxidireducens]QLA19078.1 (4Fe-4S)-binding protein [Desulfolutivibrio sulfoxidireducens]